MVTVAVLSRIQTPGLQNTFDARLIPVLAGKRDVINPRLGLWLGIAAATLNIAITAITRRSASSWCVGLAARSGWSRNGTAGSVILRRCRITSGEQMCSGLAKRHQALPSAVLNNAH